jgi:uncharacterized protein (TIGR02231 family)
LKPSPQFRLGKALQDGKGICSLFPMEDFMRFALAACLLATTCCVPVWAQDFAPPSKIDAVTVYMQGADVVRMASVDVPAGEHKITLADLPANIDPRSIRVEGTGELAIASVDSRNVFKDPTAADAARKDFEKQILALTEERSELDMLMNDANYQRDFVLKLADKQLTPQSTTETLKGIDTAQLASMLDLVSLRLATLAATTQKSRVRQREIDEKINELNQRMAELPPGQDYRTEVVINIETAQATKGDLRISYRINEAGWSPYYDAKLAIGSAGKASTLELIRRAEVTQSSGEIWKDVLLTLSTARPTGATAAPEIAESEVSLGGTEVPVADASAPVMESAAVADEEDLAQDAAKPKSVLRTLRLPAPLAIQKQATVEIAGFQANYVIATRVSVDNSGQSKKVRITSTNQEVALQAITTPRVDPAAYLTASFTMQGYGPQLGGAVNLYRDGVFVGQGFLPLLNPKEEAKLGFGVDDQIKVTRSEVKRLSGEEGFISSSNIDLRAWDVSVKNLHGIAMPVLVQDRVPFAAVKDITIEEIPGMSEPTARDVEKKRGVLSWAFTLEPQAENVLKTGYKISWPEGRRMIVVE